MSLTDLRIRKAKPADRPYKLFDSNGLYIHVQPNGSKLWRWKYRHSKKERLLSFGPYPLVSLAEAREKQAQGRKLLLDGKDPSVQRKLDKIRAETAANNTFGLVAADYVQTLVDRGSAPATIEKTRWMLENLARPLANRPINDIAPIEVLDLLKRIERSGRRESARRLRGVMGAVFRLAIATLRAESDPTAPLKDALTPPKVTGRPALTNEKEFGKLLCALDEYDGWPTIVAAMKFQILTCVRPGEVRGATRSEFALDEAVWRIPAERMKMRRPHEVPLSRQAIGILQGVWPLSEGADLVFPSIRSNRRPLSNNAFNSALRRIGYAKDEVTAHGFRVTASTIMNERGFDPDVIEAALAHQDRNAIRRTYNRAKYWEPRVELMQKWADLLDEMRTLA
jgi:integrase